ncbi:hypothetical protein C5167_010841 [Papaver somniferum]|uniref:Uncharacterized protein n=1 Tax=Papaver somniferum TaxID=3469 RepID=A0A4Y7K1B3_PAPSO|nr:hypothetical protein C5167_010841 [Papaver somniferum]
MEFLVKDSDSVPVGRDTLGRTMNFIGEAIDEKGDISKTLNRHLAHFRKRLLSSAEEVCLPPSHIFSVDKSRAMDYGASEVQLVADVGSCYSR